MFSKSDADGIVAFLKGALPHAVVLLTGAQGSGKTYVAQEIKKYRSDLFIYSKNYSNPNARISVYRLFDSRPLTAERILAGWCMCSHHENASQPCYLGCTDCRKPTQKELALARATLAVNEAATGEQPSPEGVLPQKAWRENRIRDLTRAIFDYTTAGRISQIQDWVDELQELLYWFRKKTSQRVKWHG